MNDAVHLLEQYCYFKSGSYIYFVGISIACEVGSQYPSWLNSDAGSAYISLVYSHKYQNQDALAISSFDDVGRIVSGATWIGIVVPMYNDQFKGSRFCLAGSPYAIDWMREAAQAKMQRAPRNTDKFPPEERL